MVEKKLRFSEVLTSDTTFATGRIGIKPTKSLGRLTSIISKDIKDIKEQIAESFRKHISSSISVNNLQNGLNSGANVANGLNAPLDSKHKAMLHDFYQEAWRRKYDDYIAKNKRAVPDKIYQSRPWYKKKKRMLDKEAPNYRPNKKIEYVGQGMATGYLRESIRRSFKRGGGKFLDLNESLTHIGWTFKPQSYDDKYLKWFVRVSEYMKKIGVRGGMEPFVDFTDQDWSKIADILNNIYQQGPVEDIINIIEGMRWNA